MKFTEIQNLNKEELISKKNELTDKYFRLKLNHKISQLENPLQLRTLRRDIARVNTLLSQSK
ncbi:50S ribosomal protein L29 [Candidatus Ornithobacterium hominis]|uniref:Large ribosomal subunit protein uL29 n=1 Tax=Candidatus Ornithobacterium hominis TaxID=2497989 RepID=A0A383U071_9FLAO|nr:50S ribosomal protein L29 [Candidatus Ornithobacterium hominis]MCT7904049.1 50S ribosomal protein L29 [Candidatus Ornithobacterium hominis]CAI9430028.1 50S ribosomal protein L29 [Candidatus Ornithobacterium hominis]SZD72413.1 50S ribosomal protein L29 [Candidatus Ornithobacterium hominis]SZD72700.1 50S ribosomal protein L29 [Candidatus Ornithobacterium hominis]